MDNKKIIIKKSSQSLSGLIFSLIIVIGIFTGMFFYMQSKAEESRVTIDPKYNSTYSNLTNIQTNLDSNVNSIKDNLDKIKEADSVYAVAWNGLKGLGNTLRMPISFVGNSIDMFKVVLSPLDIVPTWVKTLTTIGLISAVVFLVLSILKGDPRL